MGFSQFDPVRAVEHWGRYRPDAVALISGDDVISYSALNAEADRIAAGLASRPAGVRVAVLSQSKAELIQLILGVVRSGRPVVVLNPNLSRDALLTTLGDSGAGVVLHSGHELAAELEARLPELRAPNRDASSEPLSGPTIWGVLFSSGSTGTPKGVERDRVSIAVEAVGWCLELELTKRTTFYVGRPIFYTGGLLLALSTFLAGGAVIVGEYDDFDPAAAWADYQKQAGSQELDWAFFVPSQLREFIKLATAAPVGLTAAKSILTMGAAIGATEKLAARAVLRSAVVESWGNSESLGTITEVEDLDRRPKSIGRPFLTDRLLVVDDDGKPVPPGETGRLAGGQEAGFSGYAGRPEQTAKALKDGLIISEDLGYQDESGYFYVLGRVEDAVIVGERTIFIPQIEADVRELNGVSDCGIVAVPLGPGEAQLSCFLVVDRKPADHIREAVRARLGQVTKVVDVTCCGAIPKTAAGKTDRLALMRLVRNA